MFSNDFPILVLSSENFCANDTKSVSALVFFIKPWAPFTTSNIFITTAKLDKERWKSISWTVSATMVKRKMGLELNWPTGGTLIKFAQTGHQVAP